MDAEDPSILWWQSVLVHASSPARPCHRPSPPPALDCAYCPSLPVGGGRHRDDATAFLCKQLQLCIAAQCWISSALDAALCISVLVRLRPTVAWLWTATAAALTAASPLRSAGCTETNRPKV